jgi:hypothetical protein
MDPAQKAPPLLSARPVFDQGLVIAESAVAAALGATLGAILAGTFFFLLFNLIGLGGFVQAGGLYSTFLVLGLALSPAAYFEIKKRAWARTVYNFHADHLEYQDFKFLLQRRRGRVRYRDIRDVYERASPLQARRVLTSLYILIPGFPSQMQRGMPGIRMSDLPENAGLREKIVDIIEESNRRYIRGDLAPALPVAAAPPAAPAAAEPGAPPAQQQQQG